MLKIGTNPVEEKAIALAREASKNCPFFFLGKNVVDGDEFYREICDNFPLDPALRGDALNWDVLGVAEIDVPGVQASMSASSRVKTPDLTQQASGYVGQVTETFPSLVLPTASNPPFPMNRAVDSEATIFNNLALQLGNNTTATGTIHLFTERTPCESCSNVIRQFQIKYPNIAVDAFDNSGKT